MTPAWQEVPERSNLFWLNTITWIALRMGRWVAYALLYPITAYFVLFSDRTRTDSRRFLRRALGRDAGWRDVFRHYHTFARTLVDRIYTFGGQHQTLDIQTHGVEVLERHSQSGRGCLLVSAHLGGFELIRAVGRERHGFRVKALIDGDSTPQISSLFRRLNPSLFDDFVYMGNPNALIGLDEHTRQGGLVAILGDRSVPGDKRLRCRFFGEAAWFPEAPALLARILKVPLVMFICLNRGNGRYEVWFEDLADAPQASRSQRARETGAIMQRFADRLEHYARLSPYNWFNFYDFWQDP